MPGQAAELVFDEATKEYAGPGGRRGRPPVAHRARRRDLRARRPVRRRQDDRAAARQPAHRARRAATSASTARASWSRTSSQLRRGIGYVIQQVGLFPHMTVEANIGTVPRLYGRSKAWIHTRSQELLELVGLDASYAKLYPAQLSGGERQRVGLARALAADPPLMLMDEPFAAIDPIVRARLQDEFLRLQQEVRKTVVFVTHDVDEAIKVGDRIAILRDGRTARAVRHAGDDPRAAGGRLRRRVRRRRPRAEGARAAHRRRARARSAGRRRRASRGRRRCRDALALIDREARRQARGDRRPRRRSSARSRGRTAPMHRDRRRRAGHPELRAGQLVRGEQRLVLPGVGARSTGATRSSPRSSSTSSWPSSRSRSAS